MHDLTEEIMSELAQIDRLIAKVTGFTDFVDGGTIKREYTVFMDKVGKALSGLSSGDAASDVKTFHRSVPHRSWRMAVGGGEGSRARAER